MTGFIYAIECGDRIKIGYSTQPDLRFNKIASDAPYPCKMLGFWAGTRGDEAMLHREFEDVRIHGEWFASTERLRKTIGAAVDACPDNPPQYPSRIAPIGSRNWPVDNVIKHIRLNLFRMATQAEFAAAIGVSQAAVSRMESGSEILITVAKSIRSAAIARGLGWDDALIFDFDAGISGDEARAA